MTPVETLRSELHPDSKREPLSELSQAKDSRETNSAGYRFSVAGIPAPQGSKTPWGTEANAGTKPWREAVKWAALEHGGELYARGKPLRVTVNFYFPRPKAHYGTGRNAEVLKATAPIAKASKPDVDKLLRAVLDALTGVVWHDDCQVVDVRGVKLYGKPGAVVTVEHV